MSTSNNKRKRRVNASIAWTRRRGLFIVVLISVAGSGLVSTVSIKAPIMTTAAYAQEGENNNTATSTPSTSNNTTNTSSGIQLSSQPILQERTTTSSQTPINQTHISAIFSGNGTLTFPVTMETINFSTNGTALISLLTHSTQAKATIMTEQGETATATFYEILQIDPATAGRGKGLTMAVIHTDSTGTLAPLNGTIVAGISDLQSNEENTVTLWKWESGLNAY